jgi:hypothetical protein
MSGLADREPRAFAAQYARVDAQTISCDEL